MPVGFRLGNVIDEIGTPDFLNAFFSTISYHLEPNGWGTNYPELMLKLYQGELQDKDASKTYDEVLSIRESLKDFPPKQVVWDIDDIEAQPPWGDNISSHIRDLSNYFVTSTGKDLFDLLLERLEALQQQGGSLKLEYYAEPFAQVTWH